MLKQRTFRNAPVRKKAAKYAKIIECDNGGPWQTAFNGYLAGWLAAKRLLNAELRVKIKSRLS